MPTDQLTSGCSNGNGSLVAKVIATDGSVGYSDVSTARAPAPASRSTPRPATTTTTYWTQVTNGRHLHRADGDPTATAPTAPGLELPDGHVHATTATTLADWAPVERRQLAHGYAVCTLTYDLCSTTTPPSVLQLGRRAAQGAHGQGLLHGASSPTDGQSSLSAATTRRCPPASSRSARRRRRDRLEQGRPAAAGARKPPPAADATPTGRVQQPPPIRGRRRATLSVTTRRSSSRQRHAIRSRCSSRARARSRSSAPSQEGQRRSSSRPRT